jgi:hypothetical protein
MNVVEDHEDPTLQRKLPCGCDPRGKAVNIRILEHCQDVNDAGKVGRFLLKIGQANAERASLERGLRDQVTSATAELDCESLRKVRPEIAINAFGRLPKGAQALSISRENGT